jgi:hypothetical protein
MLFNAYFIMKYNGMKVFVEDLPIPWYNGIHEAERYQRSSRER